MLSGCVQKNFHKGKGVENFCKGWRNDNFYKVRTEEGVSVNMKFWFERLKMLDFM